MKTPKKTADLLKTRKRLLDDFAFWALHSCKIRTKEGTISPLTLNPVQRRFLADCLSQLETVGYIRSVILKGRQQGLSTFVHAFIYWWASQHAGQKAIVIAHKKDSTQTLYDMYKRTHENMPAMLKPSTKYSSRRELVFDVLDSGLVVATAGGDGIARGETLQLMHLSEVAFWPSTFANENFNGLIQALPSTPNSMAFVESTANGMTGKFYELWNGAVDGTNGWVPFFSAWFESAEYRTDPPKTFERSPDEEALAAKHGLDDAQLYWRRRQVAQNGLDLFRQEYPCTPEEAFITSGRPVFVQERIQEMIEAAPSPLRLLGLEGGRFVDDPRGELKLYREVDPGETYVIGADVAVGIKDPDKSDYCVAQVLDSDKRQVAVWRGQVNPDYYARTLSALGQMFNMAQIAPERNGHGLLVCVRLWKDLLYPNVFMDLKEGQMADLDTLNLGFQTNVSSKPLIIDKLRGDVREKQITVYDETTLREMLAFIVTESGKMQAEDGNFDDCVMALAIANHIHEGKYTPIPVTDAYYVEAI
jgi:hypothetical protein